MINDLLLFIKVNTLFSIGFSQEIDYDSLEAARPMPSELNDMYINKTSQEMILEECMDDYIKCLTTTIHRYSTKNQETICSYNEKNAKMTFDSRCHMNYENCREPNEFWNYLGDGSCDP